MQRKIHVRRVSVPGNADPYFRRGPVIPGRPLIPGRKTPPFPPFYRVDERPITFRERDGTKTREEREGYVLDWIARVRKARKMIVIVVPHEIYANARISVFHSGWTLIERDGEIRTRQCVVFLNGEAMPIGRSDQGMICVALRTSLSAWDGRTEEQSRANAA